MRYFILYEGNTEEDTVNSVNQLGEASFDSFWANRGFNILQKAVDRKYSKILDTVDIRDEQGKKYSIEEFLDKIKKLKVKIQD